MAGSIEIGQVERMVHGLTLGLIKDIQFREKQTQVEGISEREEQFQIKVTGRGEEFPSWDEVTVWFETVFIDGRGQRDSDFIHPQFYFGTEMVEGGPVGLLACITEWKMSDKNETIGCKLGIGAVSTDVARKFSGLLHATFQGFGCPGNCYGSAAELDGG